MVVLHFNMQGENIVEHTSVVCLHFDMQDGVILEHTSAKCQCVRFRQLVDHCVP